MSDSSPAIYGVCVVQNEADVIQSSLQWAARFCVKIRVWDLGSTDGTWDMLQALTGDKIDVRQRSDLPYSSSLRGVIANEWRNELTEGDWIYILDADEFLEGDPAPVLRQAEQNNARMVGVWQANFFPTAKTLADIDIMGESAWQAQALKKRFTHYCLEWIEPRFIRLKDDLVWNTDGLYSRITLKSGQPVRLFRKKMVVRHYRYRSPEQTAKRYKARDALKTANRFRYEVSGKFADLVKPQSACSEWENPGESFSVPWGEYIRASLRILFLRLQRKVLRVSRNCS